MARKKTSSVKPLVAREAGGGDGGDGDWDGIDSAEFCYGLFWGCRSESSADAVPRVDELAEPLLVLPCLRLPENGPTL